MYDLFKASLSRVVIGMVHRLKLKTLSILAASMFRLSPVEILGPSRSLYISCLVLQYVYSALALLSRSLNPAINRAKYGNGRAIRTHLGCEIPCEMGA